MHYVYPDYYARFSCTADACRHNCCIGWEIDIDPETYALYKQVSGAFGERLHRGIRHGATPCFCLDAEERCVLLNKQGLCDIILTLGEEALCDICAEHPRFRTYVGDYVYVGLGLCCEAACRLILSQSQPSHYVCEDTGVDITLPSSAPLCDSRTPAEWASVYRVLERLDPAWDACLDTLAACDAFAVPVGFDGVWARLDEYFRYRYPTHPAFGAHAVQVIQTLAAATGADFDGICELCRLYSCEIEYSDQNSITIQQAAEG